MLKKKGREKAVMFNTKQSIRGGKNHEVNSCKLLFFTVMATYTSSTSNQQAVDNRVGC